MVHASVPLPDPEADITANDVSEETCCARNQASTFLHVPNSGTAVGYCDTQSSQILPIETECNDSLSLGSPVPGAHALDEQSARVRGIQGAHVQFNQGLEISGHSQNLMPHLNLYTPSYHSKSNLTAPSAHRNDANVHHVSSHT